MYRHPNNSIYKTVVVLWLTFSIASVVLAAITWVDLSRRLREARQAIATRTELDGLLLALVDAETAQRGFSLTGNEEFLEPLKAGQERLSGYFERLLELAREDPVMLKPMVELRAKAEVCLRYQHRMIAARLNDGMAGVRQMADEAEGRILMDEIRMRVEALKGMRTDLVFRDDAGTRRQIVRASLTSLAAGILGAGAGVYAFWLARVMLGHQERERRLVEARLQAERSSREKTVFLANMSHEIRTPMNAILGFAELLSGELREPKQRKHIQAIQTSAGSLLQLINDILDMSKIEAGVMELRLEPTDPREICDFLRTVFSEPAAKRGLTLHCEVDSDLPRSLLLDRIRLRQVLVNLVGNAVKFTDAGGIDVRMSMEHQVPPSLITLRIEVQDTGVGIPPDKLGAIFKPFVQAGAHLEKEKSGTGLGLSIVHRLTEIMGGSVTATSQLNEGSVFVLRFPNVEVSARLAQRESPDPGDTVHFDDLRPSRILVVDDHEANCELVGGMFEGSHHQLDFGRDGHEAVEKSCTFQPDVILLDIRMPGMDGIAALAEIRRIPGLDRIPVIAVTASGLSNEDVELKTRFDGYIRKPFSKGELFQELALFLPRGTEKEADGLRPAQSGLDGVSRSPELLAELRRLRGGEWISIRESLAINETRQFAARLEALGGQWLCVPLENYARTLAQYAEEYAVTEMESQVIAFPALVDRLEGKAGPI